MRISKNGALNMWMDAINIYDVMKGTEVPNPRHSSACDCTCAFTRNQSLSRDSLILATRILFFFFLALVKVRSRVSDAL